MPLVYALLQNIVYRSDFLQCKSHCTCKIQLGLRFGLLSDPVCVVTTDHDYKIGSVTAGATTYVEVTLIVARCKFKHFNQIPIFLIEDVDNV